jgi:iron-sulfur cluster assembly protein
MTLTSTEEAHSMLTLTENASTIVTQILAQDGSAAGLRITADEAPQPNLELSTATEAFPGDQVVEQDGVAVYLDQVAAALLDDKVLDAAVDEGGAIEFSLVLQGPPAQR